MHEATTTDAHDARTDAQASIDPWRFVRRRTARAGFAQDESLFALANGHLGVRAGLEEDRSPSHGSFLSGIWERTPIEYHERFPGFARTTDTRLPIADGIGIALQLDGKPLDLDQGEWLDFERCLDLRHGRYQRRLRWRSPQGATLEIESERLIPLDRKAVLAIRYRVRSIDADGELSLHSQLKSAGHAAAQGDDPRIGTRVQGGLRVTGRGVHGEAAWLTQRTTHSDVRLACAQRQRTSASAGAHAQTEESVTQTFTQQLAPGQTVTLEKYVAYAWTPPGDAVEAGVLADRALAELDAAAAQGYDALAERQSALLQRFWDSADLAIDGDPATEQALRLNLFHVFQSTCRDGDASAAAKGLTGEGYEGHYFWDAEVFMLPAMLATDPALARSMLEYRYRVLEPARRHAREMNHARGALFAWRTISGDECSAYFPSGSAQYHINAAVAWAIRAYVEASGDEHFLLAKGAEILFETARVWRDVGHFDPRRNGAFCIAAITGPDEYTALVDNNHYTNRMAQRHLRYAADVAAWLAERHPEAHAALAARIDLRDDEATQWRQAADAMYLPVDPATGVFPQDDTFLDKPRLPRDDADDGEKRPLLLRMHPLTLYRHQVCKQADVVLALVLAGEQVDRVAKRRNLEYYEAVTVHDSTLSASTFSVLAADVGDVEKAYRYFLDTLRVDLDDSHGNAAHGVHLAAMAGSWQALAWGFGGLRLHADHPVLAPTLPAAWRGYRFGLRWRDAHLRVTVDADGAHYTLTEGARLTIEHDGERLELQTGQTLTRPLRTAQASPFPRRFEAVVFDLDGVIADTAGVHEAAWRRLAAEIDAPLADDIGERLKGVDRRASLDIVLEQATRRFDEAERDALAARKNSYYRERIEQFGPQDLLPGAREAVASVRAAGLKTALASASRNAPLLLERLGIAELFDYVVDANGIRHSKPDPEIFLAAAAGLGVEPSACLGVEDAAAGIASIHAAGMCAVGIGSHEALGAAEAVLPDIAAFDLGAFATP
ncbi:beta-phosphoglucomutase [Oleiagrimonas soli]|uniref:Alpha,alpha-trehalose phosphorylase n=1 Tax=Oleiagrimonas soli TaxID=1543381 RepID=A0A099CVL0_9GAMM|nr:beta-phosphoglucomutase [Oleiagrimonas soli]KGI77035.1 beta-phosphoglucomutase [Oleiagrimonas soli]MBB6185445.1 alpha,alpha-trehalose phosphorylase [Oleiagrimonas soli]